MSTVIDRHGNMKTVPDGYILQDGERMGLRMSMLMMDGLPGSGITLNDQDEAAKLWSRTVFDAAGVKYRENKKVADEADDGWAAAARAAGLTVKDAVLADAYDPWGPALAKLDSLNAWRNG